MKQRIDGTKRVLKEVRQHGTNLKKKTILKFNGHRNVFNGKCKRVSGNFNAG